MQQSLSWLVITNYYDIFFYYRKQVDDNIYQQE